MPVKKENQPAPAAKKLVAPKTSSKAAAGLKMPAVKKAAVKKPAAATSAAKDPAEKTAQIKAAEKKLKPAQPEFDMEDISGYGYDAQVTLFNAIKEVFARLNDSNIMSDKEMYFHLYDKALEDLLTLAVEGNVPAQDYLAYLYKKGREGILPASLIRAHQWGLLAIAGGSKLAVDRLRLFFNPVFAYVEDSGRAEEVIVNNNLNEETVLPFIANIMANLLLDELNINLLNMSKMDVVPDRKENVEEFMRKAETARNAKLEQMMAYLTGEA